MPVHFILKGLSEGFPSIPYLYPVLKVVPWLLLLAALKVYFGGARNKSERLMHSKVVMITGGTSGIGASIAHELASRGAQIILLTQHPPSDIFLVDYIQDLRNSTNNQLIYAEQVDLSSLHSIRTFATKWVDNAPPRRLDMIILCGNTAVPQGGQRKVTKDGLDEEWQVNYLANFHLLSILSPAIRAQPPDRDVRIVFATCSSYIGSTIDPKQTEGAAIANTTTTTKPRGKGKLVAATRPNTNKGKNHNMFGMTKLALMTFANSFQSHLSAYKRPDNFPVNARVLIVDPGFCRTPGTRRWLTRGSLLGLLFYLMTWPLWWLILKSPEQGAQSFLYATMEAKFGRGTGPWLIKECREVDFLRKEIRDEAVAKQLWEFSEKQIEAKEKEGAVKRALEKKEREEAEKKKKQQQQDTTTSTSTTTEGSGSAKAQQTPGSRRSRKAK